jgi:hypothetical protein
VSERARFLGYDVGVMRGNTYLTTIRKGERAKARTRAANCKILLEMPKDAVTDLKRRYASGGRIIHCAERLNDHDYTIIQAYQGVLRGLYNYYCMAPNVGQRMAEVKWVLELSHTKTLAHKHKCSVNRIYRRYRALTDQGRPVLRVVVARHGKKPTELYCTPVPLGERWKNFGKPSEFRVTERLILVLRSVPFSEGKRGPVCGPCVTPSVRPMLTDPGGEFPCFRPPALTAEHPGPAVSWPSPRAWTSRAWGPTS